jgi:hypothetical protein
MFSFFAHEGVESPIWSGPPDPSSEGQILDTLRGTPTPYLPGYEHGKSEDDHPQAMYGITWCAPTLYSASSCSGPAPVGAIRSHPSGRVGPPDPLNGVMYAPPDIKDGCMLGRVFLSLVRWWSRAHTRARVWLDSN